MFYCEICKELELKYISTDNYKIELLLTLTSVPQYYLLLFIFKPLLILFQLR